MRAAVLWQIPSPLEITEIEIDRPGPREVLIRTVAAGLCHSDLHFIEGQRRRDTPLVLGHESAGIVEAVGDAVSGLQPGDRVITCLSVFCGRCEFCLTGRPALCQAAELQRAPDQRPRLSRNGQPINQFANLSSFAEMMLVHEHAVVKIRDDMPLDKAALIGCGVTTGMGAVFHTAKVPPMSTVAVIGCGAIGLNCIQGAALIGASRIIAIDRLAWKLDVARQFGATDLINAATDDPVLAVKELTAGGVEYAFEAIGLKTTVEQAYAMLRRGGTATVIGLMPDAASIELPAADFLAEKRIQGSFMGSNRFRLDMPRYVDLYLAGRLKLDELLSAHITLDEINAGFDRLSRGEVNRSVILFDASS